MVFMSEIKSLFMDGASSDSFAGNAALLRRIAFCHVWRRIRAAHTHTLDLSNVISEFITL